MINIATEYIENHRLRFNPRKTICHIMGQNPFTTIPRWYINGVSLDIEDKLTYLGSILGETEAKNTVKTVVEQHIVTFWAPGAGIKSPGVNPQTALHLFNVGVSSTYPASKGMKTVWIFLFVLKAYLCGLISDPTYSY